MKNCIIFSCTIISEHRIDVLRRFLQTFQTHFSDCDIFVGINPVSLNIVEAVRGMTKSAVQISSNTDLNLVLNQFLQEQKKPFKSQKK